MKKPRHKTPSAAKRARSASGADEGDRQDKGRWSSRRKTEVVLRLFRGETLDAVSRELGVSSARLAEWRGEAFAGMQAGLQSREPDHRDGFIHVVHRSAITYQQLQHRTDRIGESGRTHDACKRDVRCRRDAIGLRSQRQRQGGMYGDLIRELHRELK